MTKHTNGTTVSPDMRTHKQHMLVTTAVGLWSERGFDGSTVAELCEAAGVSKGSFYSYFRSKESLLVEVGLEATRGIFDESFETSIEGLPLEAVLERVVLTLEQGLRSLPRDLIGHYLTEVHRHLDDWDAVRGDRRDFAAILTPVFGRAIRRGEVGTGFGPAELGSVLAGSLVNGVLAWAQGRDGGLGLEEVLRRRVQLMLHGALSPPG